MKILIVQLLRLGDIVLSTPVIQGLRDQYPNAKIDLLINRQFENVVRLLPEINQCYFFDRELIQSAIGESDRFIFEAFDRVEQLICSLNSQNYNHIFNLTHNKLSAYLTGAIQAETRIGLWYDDQNGPRIESAWFQHLNFDQQGSDTNCFHFVDIYKYSAQINRPRLGIRLRENAADREWVINYLRKSTKGGPHIVIQALTSDAKKNWQLKKFRSSIESIYASMPEANFTLLGSPNEEGQLRKAFGDLKFCEILICDLGRAYSLLLKSDLLITGDTSIKHIASASEIKIIELCLGSSDFKRTGAYSENAIIIQSQEACAPCQHNSNCPYSSHLCSDRISHELMSVVAVDTLRTRGLHLSKIAEEFSDEAKFYRVDIYKTGTWMALEEASGDFESQVLKTIRKFATKLYVQHSANERNIFLEMGTEADHLAMLMREMSAKTSLKILMQLFEKYEKSLNLKQFRINTIENDFYRYRLSDPNPIKLGSLLKELKSFEDQDETKPESLSAHFFIDDKTPTFVGLRKLQTALSKAKLKTEIEMKLVRSLQIDLEV